MVNDSETEQNTTHIKDFLIDKRLPPLPDTISGVRTEELVELGKTCSKFSTRTGLKYIHSSYVESVLSLYELLEKSANTKGGLTTKDVRPYRRAIKDVVIGSGCANDSIGCLSVFLPPLYLMKIPLNKKIEEETVKKLPEMSEKFRQQLEKYEPLVERLSEIPNPRQQYVNEIETVLSNTMEAVNEQGGNKSETAASALLQQVGEISKQEESFPLFSTLLSASGISESEINNFNKDNLAVIIPELLQAMSKVLPDDSQLKKKVVNAYWQVPELKRSAAELFKQSALDSLQDDLPKLVTQLRDIIPEDGREIKENYIQMKNTFTNSDM